VGLAAALIHQPDVLILDEPTTGLDPNQIIEIREVIREYGKQRAVLFSTHILQEVEAICDRVLIIHQGKIITDNSLRNLQRQQQQNIVRVVLGESVEERVWKDIPALHSFRKTGELEWELEGDDPEKIKKQLLALSLQNNWNLVSLQSENRSLEDIFRGLTKSPNHE
jgi:ABC-2 type transport system ATP-binding protein